MKKNINTTTKEYIKGLLVLIVFIITLIFCSKIETNYSIKGSVIQVRGNNTLVQDTKGNEWECITDEFNVNDKVILIMHNNHTDKNLKDDYILSIKKNEN